MPEDNTPRLDALEARLDQLEPRVEAVEVKVAELAPPTPEETDLAAWTAVCQNLVDTNPAEHPDLATASANFINLLRNEGIIT